MYRSVFFSLVQAVTTNDYGQKSINISSSTVFHRTTKSSHCVTESESLNGFCNTAVQIFPHQHRCVWPGSRFALCRSNNVRNIVLRQNEIQKQVNMPHKLNIKGKVRGENHGSFLHRGTGKDLNCTMHTWLSYSRYTLRYFKKKHAISLFCKFSYRIKRWEKPHI